MKVLGARTRQVVTVVLAEMVSLGTAGAVIGLLVMSPPVLWQLGTAAPTPASFAATMLRLGGSVILTAVVVCGVFGGIPTYLMVTRTAEETLMEGG